MKKLILCLIAGVPLASPALAQDDRPRRQPVREELREDLVQQLERLRMRERWLERQIEAMDRGEKPEPAPHGEPDARRPEKLSDEDKQRLLGVLRDLQSDPDLAGGETPFQRILETEGPERERLLVRLAPRLQRLIDLKDNDPERYDATRREMVAGIKIARAARQFGIAMRDPDATDETMQQARRVLRAAIAEGFDARAEMMKFELKDAQDKLDSLTSEVSRAESERDRRIDEQLDRMSKRIEAGGEPRGTGGEERPPQDRERRQRPSRDD